MQCVYFNVSVLRDPVRVIRFGLICKLTLTEQWDPTSGVLGGGFIKSALGTWVGKKQDENSVFLATKAFRRERVGEWWFLTFCLNGIGCYPSCHLWQKLITLPPQRGLIEGKYQVIVKLCCFDWRPLLFTHQSGKGCSSSSNILAFSFQEAQGVLKEMSCEMSCRTQMMPPSSWITEKAFINVLCFCKYYFFVFCFYFLIPGGGNTS